MKTLLSLASILYLMIGTVSCNFITINKEAINSAFNKNRIIASSNIIVKDYEIEEFDCLNFSISSNVTYTKGPAKITIEGPDNVLEHIVVVNDNGKLTVKSDGTIFSNLGRMRTTISSMNIKDISLNGSSDFSSPQLIESKDFSININGSGDIDLNGLKCNSVLVKINGSGDCSAKKLECKDATVFVNGSGDCTLEGKASDKVYIKVNGSGDIYIEDFEASKIETKINGSGKLFS